MTSISAALEIKADETPAQLVLNYAADFAAILPGHMDAQSFLVLALRSLAKGKKVSAPNERDPNHHLHGRYELEVAAANNPGVFYAALLDAARQGLQPGTEQYYLTCRRPEKGAPNEIFGIVGYQGYVQLMYRAGAAGVWADTVRTKDEFEFAVGQLDRQSPPRWAGPQEIPYHRVQPFAPEADRGPLIGAYAYARLGTGQVSRVVMVNADDIKRIKSKNPTSAWDSSPWVNWEAEMWLKVPLRRLRKVVPTSPEFERERVRALNQAASVADVIGATAIEAATEDGELDGEVQE